MPKFVSKTDYQNITVSYELKFKYLSDILDKDDPLINNITIMAKMPTSYETLELIGLSGEYLLYQKVLSSGSGSPSGFFAKADDYYLLSGRTLFPRNNEEFYQLGGSRSTILIGKNRPIVNISTESDLIQIEDDFIGSTIESNVFVASFLYYSEDLGRKCNIRCSDEGVEITNIRETITISNQEILVYRVKLSKLLPDTVYDISLY